ncbi:MAG: hypothetical protein J6032_08425 [Bacteroidales bacterium]|nr:hypothetical protein [Bacteroidales bacterium]
MQIAEVFSQPKGRIMEDAHVVTPHYIAVFDGATPKTAFRFSLPDGSQLTPGQVAARTLAKAVGELEPYLTAREAVNRLSAKLRIALQGHRAEASGVICSIDRNEVWMVGDCQFGFVYDGTRIEVHHTEKVIDGILSRWRSTVVKSYLSRNLLTPEDISHNDPGRRIIQPFITRQVLYQNDPSSPLGFGVFDGSEIPDCYLEVFPVPRNATALILASDGYPKLHPTLQESEIALQQLLKSDPLCIGDLCETKGILAGNCSHDDRTYLKILL